MKSHLIIICLLLLNIQISAQIELCSSFNYTHSGRNITFVVSKKFNKNEIGGGLRININKLAHNDDQNNIYLKRLYATKPFHYIGTEGFYHRYILTKINWVCVKPFIFYDFQSTYSTTRNRLFVPTGIEINGEFLYIERIEYFGPFLWIEQCLGVGFKVDLIKSFYITQRIGGGVSFILGYDDQIAGKLFDWFEWEFGGLITVGIGYRF